MPGLSPHIHTVEPGAREIFFQTTVKRGDPGSLIARLPADAPRGFKVARDAGSRWRLFWQEELTQAETVIPVEIIGDYGHTRPVIKIFSEAAKQIAKPVDPTTEVDKNKELGDLIARLMGEGLDAVQAAKQAESMLSSARDKKIAKTNQELVSARIQELMAEGLSATDAAEKAKKELDLATE